ncbi:MAG: HalOD1 output domain-containing protein [Halosimplex sp.]
MSEETREAIVRREFDTDQDDPATAIAETVAELEGKASTDLTTMYEHVDHVVDHMFSNPPVSEAQVEITFTYEGYRITLDQDGNARFVDVA